jgi:ABC-2 type transport system permease protein
MSVDPNAAPSWVPSAPDGRPAPTLQRILRRAWLELLLLMRNGEQLLLTLVIPTAVLVVLPRTSLLDGDQAQRLDATVPGVLALAVLSTAFTAAAISLAFDRRYGVLRQLGAGPLGRGGLITARTLAVLGVVALQTVVLLVVAVVLGWEPSGQASTLVSLVVVLVLGVAAFTGPALLLGGTLRSEAVLALANLIYLALLVGGGLFAVDGAPGPVAALPSAALAEALRAVLDGAVPPAGAVAVLTGWAVIAGGLATRFLRWD